MKLLLFGLCGFAAASGDYTVTHKAEFEIEIGGKALGVIEMGLFGNAVPLTVDNFCKLAEGFSDHTTNGKVIGYEG